MIRIERGNIDKPLIQAYRQHCKTTPAQLTGTRGAPLDLPQCRHAHVMRVTGAVNVKSVRRERWNHAAAKFQSVPCGEVKRCAAAVVQWPCSSPAPVSGAGV